MPKKKTKEKRRDEKTPDYLPIGPVVDEGTYFQYAEVLENGVQNKEIKNIGIIAPYGAGKSSLIKTWAHQRSRGNKDISYVSLASFHSSEVSTKKETKESTDSLEDRPGDSDSGCEDGKKTQVLSENAEKSSTDSILSSIERGILEQLLFSVSPSVLPRSHISRIKRLWPKALTLVALLVFTICSFALAVLSYKKIDPFSVMGERYWAWGVAGALFFGGLLTLLLLWSSSVKLSSKNIEVEINKPGAGSVLSLFLDEIIYFFERSKKRIVVFEDIDRFNNLEIFVRLRELNTVLNSSEKIKERITFIYAIKDELFKDREGRLKFFDLVISLIPMTGRENARSVMKKSMKEADIIERFPAEFLIDISSFLADPRAIKSTINDYLMFNKNLKIREEDQIPLFSFLVYKNLLPSDFAKFQVGQGNLWKLLANKTEWLSEKIGEFNRQIGQLQEQIKEIQSKHIADSFDQLKERVAGIIIIYGQRNMSPVPGLFDIRKVTSFVSLQKSGSGFGIPLQGNYGTVIWLTCDSKIVEKHLGCSPTEAEKALLGENELTVQRLSAVIETKTQEREALRTSSLRELAQEDFIPTDLWNSFGDQKEAMQYLLINGYVNETSVRFVSATQNNLGSPKDDSFIKAVLSKSELDITYDLDNPGVVIKDLGIDYFRDRFVWNVSLIKELVFSSGLDTAAKRAALCERLAGDSSLEGINLLKEIAKDGDTFQELIKLLLVKSNVLVRAFLVDNSVSESSKSQVARAVLSTYGGDVKLTGVTSLPIAPIVTNSESPIEEFLITLKTKDSLGRAIDDYQMSFPKVDKALVGVQNFDWYYETLLEKSALAVSEWNLSVLCGKYAGISDVSFGTLISIDFPPAKSYIQGHLEEIAALIASGAEKTLESEDGILYVLEQADIGETGKIKYLNNVAGAVDLQKVKDSKFFKILLSNDLVQPSWQAIALLTKDNSIPYEDIGEFMLKNSSVFAALPSEATITKEKRNRLLESALARLDDDNFFRYFYDFQPSECSFSSNNSTKVSKEIAEESVWLNELVKRGYLKASPRKNNYSYKILKTFPQPTGHEQIDEPSPDAAQ